MAGIIPLVRATGLGDLPVLLQERVGERAMIRLLQGQDLPLALCEPIDVAIPLHAVVGMFESSAGLLGDRTLGLQVGQIMTHAGYGYWARYAANGESLKAAIQRLNRTSWAHQTHGFELSMTQERGRWIWRVRRLHRMPNRMQHSDHLLMPMISMCRLFLGRSWNPAWVEVDYDRDPGAHLIEQKLNVPVHFGKAGVAVALSPEEAEQKRPGAPLLAQDAVTLREICAEVALRDSPELVRSVASIVSLRLLDGLSDIDGAARLAGTGVQTLQRALRLQGYTYREVLAACRQARAAALLRETTVPVSDIAVALGYEELANFSRAFSGWFGLSPRHYRDLHGHG